MEADADVNGEITRGDLDQVRVFKLHRGDVELTKKIHDLSWQIKEHGGISAEFVRLGEASGQDFWHCVYLGSRYSENFVDRVVGFIELPAKTQDMPTRVVFFEKTPNAISGQVT